MAATPRRPRFSGYRPHHSLRWLRRRGLRWLRRRPGRPPSSRRTRLILVFALAAAMIVAGTYTLGRAVGTQAPPAGDIRAHLAAPAPETTGTPAPESTDRFPPNPRERRVRAASPSPTGPAEPRQQPDPSAPDQESAPDGDPPRLPLERTGPFGSRTTTGTRDVALTFDDGPDPRYTPQVLELLRRHQVKATFCLVGTQVREYPELVREIAADGHTLCNHSWSHDLDLGRRTRATIRTDLTRTNDAIRAAVPGARIAYYRQPGGNWSSAVVATAWELGMTSLHWAVDPRDWTEPGAGNIAGTVTAGTAPGAIVLLHDAGGDRRQTVSALRTILSNLTRRFDLGGLPTGPARAEPARAEPARRGTGTGTG